MRQLMAETIVKIGDLAASFCEQNPESVGTKFTLIVFVVHNYFTQSQLLLCLLAIISRGRDIQARHAAPRERSLRTRGNSGETARSSREQVIYFLKTAQWDTYNINV